MSKILIIDDEVQIRSLLARMLGLEGYEVCQNCPLSQAFTSFSFVIQLYKDRPALSYHTPTTPTRKTFSAPL